MLHLFHGLRKSGNAVTHVFNDDRKAAVESLMAAWQIALWFCRTFVDGQEDFVSEAFNPAYLQTQSTLENSPVSNGEEQYLLKAQEAELAKLRAELAAKSEKEQQARRSQLDKRFARSRQMRDLDEKQTRLLLIDVQLREAGWEADTENLNYQKGTYPEKGRNLAIAEYPCGKDRADYVLFCGLMPIATADETH